MTDMVELVNGEEVTLAEAMERLSVDPIIERYGTWAVTNFGVECLVTLYYIEWDRLDQPDWEEHVCAKRWVNCLDFQQAFRAAKRLRLVLDPAVRR